MNLLLDGIRQALEMLFKLDPEVIEITLLSLKLSGIATLISLAIGIPFGTGLALYRFPGRNLALSLINTGMGLPPVVVGLLISILLWRSGPLGDLEWIYTPTAIIIAQIVLATPVVTGLTSAALQQLDPRLRLQLVGLGASSIQTTWTLWMEARMPLLAALMAGFGSVISEVGASMMVGGNLRHSTRILTTSIVYETGRGNFAMAIAMGVILLGLTFLINWLLTWIQQRDFRA